MYCEKCGNEVQEGAVFCTKCGAKLSEEPLPNENAAVDGAQEKSGYDEAVDQDETVDYSETVNQDETMQKEQANSEEGVFSKFWNSPIFTKVAVKFGHILDIIGGIIGVLVCKQFFSEGGFWGIAFGILFLVGGIVSILAGVVSFFSKESGDETQEELGKKKRNLCIGVIVIIIGIIILQKTGGGAYYNIKQISFDYIRTETIGEIIDENLKSPKWSQEKIDNESKMVYVEGFSPLYGEKMKITFYYEEWYDEESDEQNCWVSLQSISFPNSGEIYSDAVDTAFIWASFD